MQPDPYNNNYNNNSWGSPQPQASPIQPIIDLIKGNLKTIILLIIVLGGAYLAYDYFVASQINVKITVNDLSGEPVQTITSGNVWLNGNPVPKSSFTGPSKSMVLQRGKYEVRVSADGFEDSEQEITVSQETSSFNVVMIKKTSVKLQPVTNFPTQIFAGQTLESTLTLDNTGATETVNLKAVTNPATLNGFKITLNPAQVVVSGTQTVTVTIEATEALAITDKAGKDISVTFSIDGTKQSQKATIKAFKAASISASSKSITIPKTDAGKTTANITVTFKNNDSVAYDDFSPQVIFEISHSNNSEADVNKWLAVITNPTGLLDKKKSSDPFVFNLVIPKDALDDVITGKLVFKTDYWEQEIPITITVASAKNLAVFTVNPSKYDLRIDKDTGKYEIKTGTISIKNATNFTLKNLTIKTKDPTNCKTDYIKYSGEVSYPDLEPTAGVNQIDIPINVSAPIAAAKDIVKSCVIVLAYDDPIEAGAPAISIERTVSIKPTD